jgi:CHASE3 domain sensor protein
MAAISLSVDGDKIQISFQKEDQTTAVVMDAGSARTLAAALTQLVAVMAEADDAPASEEDEGDIEDVTSPTIDIGVDEEGQPILALQAGAREPMLLRLQDDEARHVAESLLSILESPRDVRQSRGGH